MFTRKLNLVVGNHLSITGISDAIELITDSFKSFYSNILIELTTLPKNDEVNILFEEFSSDFFVKFIINQKIKYPKTVYILFLTEIVNKNSFNALNFWEISQSKILDYKADFLSNYETDTFPVDHFERNYFILNDKQFDDIGLFVNDRYKQNIIKEISSLQFPNSIKKIKNNILNSLFRNFFMSSIYWKKRYLNTKFVVDQNVIDHIFCFHSEALTNFRGHFDKAIYFPYFPNFSYKFETKPIYGIFSGTVTRDRKNLLEKISSEYFSIFTIAPNDFQRNFYMTQSIFNVGLPRYNNWSFSSPTRTFSGLKLGAFPINFGTVQLDFFEAEINALNFKDISSLCFNDVQEILVNNEMAISEALNKRREISFQFISGLLNSF